MAVKRSIKSNVDFIVFIQAGVAQQYLSHLVYLFRDNLLRLEKRFSCRIRNKGLRHRRRRVFSRKTIKRGSLASGCVRLRGLRVEMGQKVGQPI